KTPLSEAREAFAVFSEGGVSAIELRAFLDRELPDWLKTIDPVNAPALRSENPAVGSAPSFCGFFRGRRVRHRASRFSRSRTAGLAEDHRSGQRAGAQECGESFGARISDPPLAAANGRGTR